MESKQTAVQWLVEQLTPSISLQSKYIQEFKEQALAMEKQQIMDAYDKNKMGRVDYGEQYYNETYGM